MKPAIVVTGSLNMDFVVIVDHLPTPGETVLGTGFQMLPGGKGANQACAAGKLAKNAVVRMVGRVGYDIFADQLRASLSAANVDVSLVSGTRSKPTGVAFIEVDKTGQNSIVVASGANFALTPADMEGVKSSWKGARFALFQLETPLPTVEAALRIARTQGARTILDPAPAQPLSRSLLAQIDVLTPNESEACLLLGRPPSSITVDEAADVAGALVDSGATAVVLKLGAGGCFYRDSGQMFHVEGFSVDAVDTTAAGDIFNAAFAVALTEDFDLKEGLRFANAAAAISVTRHGAQGSVPSRVEVEEFLRKGSGQ